MSFTSTEHQVFMANAKNYAELSKCVRLQVGCVVVNEHGCTITTGVNGTGRGQVNCCDVDHGPNNEHHHAWSKVHELHAEKNALFNLLATGARYRELTFYVTHSPCQGCLTDIVVMAKNFDIKIPMIVFDQKYDRMDHAELMDQWHFCRNHGIELISMKELLEEGM